MATPWWAKVSPHYYDKPPHGDDPGGSGLSAALDKRSRHYAAVLADTHLSDEPQLAGAFLNANVPYSIAQKLNRQYQIVKNQAATNVLGQAGMGTQATADQKASGKPTGPPAVPVPAEDTSNWWSDLWDGMFKMPTDGQPPQPGQPAPGPTAPNPVTDTLSLFDGLLEGSKSIVSGGLHGLNAVFSPVMEPYAQTFANQPGADYQTGDKFGKAVLGDNPAGSLFGGFVGTMLPVGLGASGNVPGGYTSKDQAADMKRAGYDPNSWASRYAWYYDAMEPGQRAVADSDIRGFKQQYDPEKVDTVREIITSNFLNDKDLNALSPASQAFIQDLVSDHAKPEDLELFDRMSKASGTRPGGVISQALGQDMGSPASYITAAVGDLAYYWYSDPIAGTVKAATAARMERMVPAGSLAAYENKIVAVKDPGNPYSGPATKAGDNMNEMLVAVHRVDDYMRQAYNTTVHDEQVAALGNATKVWENWSIKHPDQVNQWSLVAQWKSGRIQFIKPKTDEEMAKATAKAADGKTPMEPYWIGVTDKPTKPGYHLDFTDENTLNKSLNDARADLASRMSEWMYFNAWTSGRPVIKGQVMLPGEVAVNAKVRAAIAPIRNRLMGSEGRISDYLNDIKAQRHAEDVHFDGSLDKLGDLFLGKTTGEWVRANYTQKWTATLEKIASRFGMSYSGREVVFAGPESLQTFQRMGLAHMPRRMAQVMAINWAKAGPAERRMMAKQWQEMLAEAAHFNNSPLAREVKEVLTKGSYPSAGEARPNSINPGEVYTANRADNEIRVGDQKLAAGIWDYQMADRMLPPDYRQVRALQQATGFLSWVTGLFNKRILNGPTAIWKVGKVGNPANMMRQVAEGYTLLIADQGFRQFMNTLGARRYSADATVEARLAAQHLTSAANKFQKATQGKPALLRKLEEAARGGDVIAYRGAIADIATEAGFKTHDVAALSNLAEGLRVDDVMRLTPWGKTAVAMSGLLTPLREIRLTAAPMAAKAVPGLKSPKAFIDRPEWHDWSDQSYINGMTAFALGEFGHAADDAIFLAGGSVRQELAGAARLGVPGRPAVLPNAHDWLGTAGDGGAINWFRELDSRQTDALGHEVMRALAVEARHDKGAGASGGWTPDGWVEPVAAAPGGNVTIAAILNQARTGEQIPAHLDSARDITHWLITQSEKGAKVRAMADRLAYDEYGGRVATPAPGFTPWDDAVERLVDAQVRDAALHLGAREKSDGPGYVWDVAYNKLLDKLGYDKRITQSDLTRIPNRLRPEELSASVYIPGLGKASNRSIVDMASKLYSFTVARPLQRLAINPIYLANKNLAYRQLTPVADELLGRGFTPAQTGALLEHTANKYAVNTTFRYTDNVAERSFFSEVTENFLMFQRASEDFLRRFMKVTSANPAIVSKAYLLMEAANHSGMIYPQSETNDDGTEETHMVFTFPGSGLMAKAIQDAGRALGWGDSDLVATALYSSMSSQVRYINPSLSNPFGFSTSPMIGMPLRFARSLFPEMDKSITNTLARMEGGGERFFAEQSVLQSLLPTPLGRLAPALGPVGEFITGQDPERDGQLASAVRNALVYYQAAGLLPGENATDDEVEEAHEAIKDMAINQLVWRAVVGTFSPWVPQYNAPQGTGLPEADLADQLTGINNIRGEWFEVLREAAEKVGGEAAMGKASEEWFRRHPSGGSIVNPGAFLTGTTDNPGNAGEAPNVASGPSLTQFMVSNKDWLKQNQTVAYYLLPNYLEAQYTQQGMRDQLRNGVRVHRDGLDFYKEMRYQTAMKTYWDQVNQKSALIAAGNPASQVNKQFKQWEQDWKTAHPATSAEKERRENPEYVKGTLVPALSRLVASNNAPAGVDLTWAKRVLDHYNAYQAKYNKAPAGTKGQDQRYSANEKYRQDGDRMFLGTPAHDLWKAMDIYENGY